MFGWVLAYAVDGNPVKDPAWVDTVNVSHGSSVDLAMDFTDPIIRGMCALSLSSARARR
jgi:hypothetical protein